MGIFGTTSFLQPIYGVSELIQAFCRMSAVCGTTFILRRKLSDISLDDNTSSPHVTSVNGNIKCGALLIGGPHLLVNVGHRWQPEIDSNKHLMSGSLLYLGTPLLPEGGRDGGGRRVVVVAPMMRFVDGETVSLSNNQCIFIMYSDSSTMSCPPGVNLLQMTTSLDSGDEDRARLLFQSVVRYLRTSTGNKNYREMCRRISLRRSWELRGPLPDNMAVGLHIYSYITSVCK